MSADPSAIEALNDVYERIASKVSVLNNMAQNAEGVAERARLRGKAEGVSLALSFVHDARRLVSSSSPPKGDTT